MMYEREKNRKSSYRQSVQRYKVGFKKGVFLLSRRLCEFHLHLHILHMCDLSPGL